MKFISFLLLFTSYTLISNGQKIERFFNYDWKACHKNDASFYSLREKTDSGYIATDYFLGNGKPQMTGKYSDSLGKVRNGYFTYYYPGGQVSGLGRFVDNKKDGLWQGFYMDGKRLDSAVYADGKLLSAFKWFENGQICDSLWQEDGKEYAQQRYDNGKLSSFGQLKWSDGKRLGEWVFYHYNGNRSAQIKYNTQGEVVNASYFDEDGDDETATALPFVNPYKEMAYKDWVAHIRTSLKMPELATLKTPGKAVVVVSFYVDEQGRVQDPVIKVPLHPKYDEAALELVKSGPQWPLAMNYNRKIVKLKVNQPVFFNVK